MPESASEPSAGLIWDEPIARPVIAEICQLLGYDADDVVRVTIGPHSLFVVTASVARDPAGDRIVHSHHRHSIL